VGLTALALTDHDGLYGAVRFQQAAAAAGLLPILGAEMTLEAGDHLVLLARNRQGFRNLCRVVTDAQVAGGKGQARLSLETLEQHREGLFVLSGCERGELAAKLRAGKWSEARAAAGRYRDLFGPDAFFVELQNMLHPHSAALVRELRALARETGLRVVAANNVHQATKPEFPLQDCLACAGALVTVDEPHPRRKTNAEYYLKSPRAMARLFPDCPEALHTAGEIAAMCEPSMELGVFHFPDFPLPPGETPYSTLCKLCWAGARERYRTITPEVMRRLEHELAIIERKGFATYFLVMWDIVRHARSRGIRCSGRGSAADSLVTFVLRITDVDPLAHGLLFERFLNPERSGAPDIDIDFDANRRDEVIDYVYRKYGREHAAMVCTVSTLNAKSAVRDLGKALDFPPEEIDRFAKALPHTGAHRIRDVLQRLPELRDADLPTWKLETLLDLCERASGYPRHLSVHLGGMVVSKERLDELAPLEWSTKGVIVTQWDKDDVEAVGLIKMDLLSLKNLAAIEDALALIRRSGVPKSNRVRGQDEQDGNADGIVGVSPDRSPVLQDSSFTGQKPGAPSNYPVHPVHPCKFSGTSQRLDIDRIPLDDPKVFALLRSTQTLGVFQVESPGMRGLLGRLQPTEFEDIIAQISLFRPGPLTAHMIDPFVARRHGREPVTYFHPRLEPVLKSTYGVILYQEQVLEIASVLAGFSLGQADLLRRAMTTDRSSEEMEKIRQSFLDGCAAQGVDAPAAEATWKALSAFAAYGFCKAHAAAFARIAYQTAYLKVYYPAEFLCSILNNQPMGFYSSHTILQEARRLGLRPLPPDINRSEARWSVEGDQGSFQLQVFNLQLKTDPSPHACPGLRIGLKQVKGMTQADLDSIAAARSEGPFVSLADFCARTTVPRDVVENLILCGAFDSLEPNRRALFWELEAALASRTPAVADEEGQSILDFWERGRPRPLRHAGGAGEPCFGCAADSGGGRAPGRAPSKIDPPSLFERVRWEVEVLGLSPTVHPTVLFQEQLALYRPRKIAQLSRMPNGARVTTAGTVVCRMRPPTKSGVTVVFITMEDETGLIDTVLFPAAYDRYGAAAFASNLLVVEGKLQRLGARDLSLILEKVINPLEGWVEPEIEGRTGTARRDVALPWLGEPEDDSELYN
jgi:DNA-directed DNA polymerase III PolC